MTVFKTVIAMLITIGIIAVLSFFVLHVDRMPQEKLPTPSPQLQP